MTSNFTLSRYGKCFGQCLAYCNPYISVNCYCYLLKFMAWASSAVLSFLRLRKILPSASGSMGSIPGGRTKVPRDTGCGPPQKKNSCHSFIQPISEHHVAASGGRPGNPHKAGSQGCKAEKRAPAEGSSPALGFGKGYSSFLEDNKSVSSPSTSRSDLLKMQTHS